MIYRNTASRACEASIFRAKTLRAAIPRTARFGVSAFALAALFWTPQLIAQTPPAVATYPELPAAAELVSQTQTSPPDDTVSESAPASLALQFPHKVHLVKLILRNQSHDWVDISFRYTPRLDSAFEWALPALADADYYTAEWAILDDQDRLIRGNFSFSFGSQARMPSVIRAEEELALRLRNGEDEVTRFVTPPRTEIILDQEPRAFDPPFTLRLEDRPNP